MALSTCSLGAQIHNHPRSFLPPVYSPPPHQELGAPDTRAWERSEQKTVAKRKRGRDRRGGDKPDRRRAWWQWDGRPGSTAAGRGQPAGGWRGARCGGPGGKPAAALPPSTERPGTAHRPPPAHWPAPALPKPPASAHNPGLDPHNPGLDVLCVLQSYLTYIQLMSWSVSSRTYNSSVIRVCLADWHTLLMNTDGYG